MFTQTQLNCCLDHLPSSFFQDKKLLILGAVSTHVSTLLSRLGCHVNRLDCDVILHCGLLSSLQHLEAHLEYACHQCTYLILETDVLDTSETICTKLTSGWNATKPSAAYIENLLKHYGFSYHMVLDPRLNERGQEYDWKIKETMNINTSHRRLWLCWKSTTNLNLRT